MSRKTSPEELALRKKERDKMRNEKRKQERAGVGSTENEILWHHALTSLTRTQARHFNAKADEFLRRRGQKVGGYHDFYYGKGSQNEI